MKWRTMTALLVSMGAVMVSGCAVTPATRPKVTDYRTYDSDFDTAWNAVVDVIAEKNLPIKTIEKDSGIITTEEIGLPLPPSGRYTEWMTFPDVPAGIWVYPPKWKASILVRNETEPNRVRIRISTWFSAFERNMTGKWHEGFSTGLMEERFFTSVSGKLKKVP